MTNCEFDLTPAGTPRDAFYAGLRQLKAQCGNNKNDQALVLIAACIEERIDTAAWIIATLKPLGLDARHLGMVLNGRACADEASTLWKRDSEGKYTLLAASR